MDRTGELKVTDLSIFLKKNERPVVNQISFSLQSGESLVLLGQSGCGKTITCRAVMGLLNQKKFRIQGSILFDGTELVGLSERKRKEIYGKHIAFIPQNPMTALDPSVKIGKQMDETLKFHTGEKAMVRRNLICAALEGAGLSQTERIMGSFPHMLSGGMLQRVLIAMAISTNAGLILADEPTTALDVVHRNEIVDAFAGLRANGAAVLFVTHDFTAARRLGGDALIMYEGEIVERGKIAELYQSSENAYTRALVKASALSGEKRNAGC